LDIPQGVTPDEGYQKWAKSAAHEAMMTAAQLKTFSKSHNEYVKSILDQQETDYKMNMESDKQQLMKEWRGGYERMMNAASTAAKSLGFTPEMIDAIERTSGFSGTMKFFANLGQKMGEHGFVTDGNKSSGSFSDGLTPEEAKAEWANLKMDDNFMKILGNKDHPGHKTAQEKQNKLFAIMYP
jgi:hypothetical protein